LAADIENLAQDRMVQLKGFKFTAAEENTRQKRIVSFIFSFI